MLAQKPAAFEGNNNRSLACKFACGRRPTVRVCAQSASMTTNKPFLHYWKHFRGKGDPIRMALAYKGIDWDEDDIAWGTLKNDQSLFAFFQAPAYVEGGRRFWQMNAILRHLGRTQGLYGDSEDDMITVDMALDTVEAMWVKYVPLIYWDKLSDEAKQKFYEKHVNKASMKGYNQGAHVAYYEWFCLQNSPFITGNKLTVGDITLWWGTEMMMRLFEKEITEQYPALTSYYKRFAEHPGIKEYLTSDRRPKQQNGFPWG